MSAHNYDQDPNVSASTFKLTLIVCAVIAAIVAAILLASAVSAQTIYLPNVQRSRPEPTITPMVSVGGPWIAPTVTPTVTPPAPTAVPEVQQ